MNICRGSLYNHTGYDLLPTSSLYCNVIASVGKKAGSMPDRVNERLWNRHLLHKAHIIMEYNWGINVFSVSESELQKVSSTCQ